MSNRSVKKDMFDQFAVIGKALSSGRRGEIVDILANGERSVDSLAEQIGQSVANTSQHLQILKNAGLVKSSRRGTFVYYRLASSEVITFWRSMQSIAGTSNADAERLAREYLGDDDIEEVTKDELWDRLQREDNLVVLDVRPPEEYEAGHLPGAVSIPLAELQKRMKELPKGKQIVAYCRGPLCAMAPQAARFLKSKGYKVRRLSDGAPDWAAAGLPIAKPDDDQDSG
ncbi:MAG: ArsR/SmtB family transcription factor [Actinomycetota bacterium]